MSTRHKERKPPMELEEIEQKSPMYQREEPGPGEITYVPAKSTRTIPRVNWDGGSKKVKDTSLGAQGKLNNPRVRLLVSIVVSVVLAAFMLYSFAPNKTEVRNLEVSIQTLSEQLNDLRTRLEVAGW